MSETGSGGLDRVLAIARELEWKVWVGPPSPEVPATILGAGLDPELRGVLSRHDGIKIWGDPFALFIRGLGGEETVEHDNESLRRMNPDDPFPFDRVLTFAQWGYQASYLACVPDRAGHDGRQPVVYLDTHEAAWAVPIASSVGAAFHLAAEFVERGLEHPEVIAGMIFPWDVAELARKDRWLIEMVDAEAFDSLLGGQEAALEWIATLSGRHRTGR